MVTLATFHANLEKLMEDLAALKPSSIDDEARLVLRHVLGLGVQALPVYTAVDLCPNCDGPCPNLKSPYCSEWCKAQASMVRQFRSNTMSGVILEHEKQAVYGQILWWLIGGGYPRRVAMLTEAGKRQALRRVNGVCGCGALATTFDHLGSACNRPSNLKPVCKQCARIRPFLDSERMLSEQAKEVFTSSSGRMLATAPLRICDDPQLWDWRVFVKRDRPLTRSNPNPAKGKGVREAVSQTASCYDFASALRILDFLPGANDLEFQKAML